MERFFNEARAATAIRHPGIIEIYDFGWTPDGAAFIVMELLRGESLGMRLARGAMPWQAALAVTRQIAGALGAAHIKGIVHRDLKPDNIFLVPDPEVPGGERAKLLDFGIAKLVDTRGPHTQVGSLMGTPTYMAPEQCRGAEVDARADLYALGCILFQLCTGRPPFVGESLGLLVAHLETPPPPISSFAAAVPMEVNALVQRLLAKLPHDRVQTADELIRLIDKASPQTPAPLALRPKFGHTVATFFGGLFQGARHYRADDRASRSTDAATRLDAVEAAVPPAMRPDAISIAAFIRASFTGARAVRPHVLALERPELPSVDSHDSYCIFVSRGTHAAQGGMLGTEVFAEETRPLDEHLRGLVPERSKVVIAVVDTPELARGVRRHILRYRREFEALVLVVYVGELRKLSDDRHRRRWFVQRLDDAARARPFAARAALREPTEFVSNRHVVAELAEAIERRDALILVSGIPGSGKTSLVNMAYFELDATQYVRIRCSSQKSSVDAFCRVIAEALGTVPSSETQLRDLLRSAARSLAAAAKVRHERVVLVLEDADWLVTLAAGKGDATEVEVARALWTELAELAASDVVGVVATAVRGFVLQRRVIDDWENPFATHLVAIHVRGMTVEGIHRIAGDLGESVGLGFDDAAIRKLHTWSGGHIDLARRICDRLLDERGDSGPPARHRVGAAEVDRACKALVAAGTTFRDSLIPWLDAGERAVLQTVARDRPRTARRLKDLLADELDEVSAGDALEHLRDMGLVAYARGRETVTIQLLARWICAHGASQPHLRHRRTARRMVIAAIATTVLLLIAGVYSVWLHDRMITSAELRHGDCTFRFKHSERAAQGETVKLYVFRECRTSTDAAVVLGEIDSTVATIDQRPLKFVPHGSRSERADVSIVLEQPDAAGDGYRFALELEAAAPGLPPLGELEIMHDAMAELRRTLEGAAKISMAALSVMLLIMSLQRRAFSVLRRLVKLIRGGHRKTTRRPP